MKYKEDGMKDEVQGPVQDLRKSDFLWEALDFSSDRGQVLPWAVMLIMLFLGFCALTIDIGHGLLVKRELQASCDAAALASAETLPSTTYVTIAQNFSAMAGGKNIYHDFSVGTPTVTGLCLTTVKNWGIPCSATSPNAVSVTETTTIPTFFAGIFGMRTLTVSATSTASKGSRPQPFNVAIILDTTPSMKTQDNNCGATQLQCATDAFQYLLANLDPSVDNVSLFTFPDITTTTVSNDYDCKSGSPTVGPYTFPPSSFPKGQNPSYTSMPYTTGSGKHTQTVQETYQVTGWLNDYRTSDTSTSLNSKSNLSNAVGGNNCNGIQTSNENTYYAGAIYAAQASLLAEQAAHPGTQNAIILLSDGNATAQEQDPGGSFSVGYNDMVTGSQSTSVATNSGTYPSWIGECGQGVDAAQAASAQGTRVFTIAYGSATSSNSANCGSDRNGGAHRYITPCQAMQQMSTGWNASPQNTSNFFSDYYAPGGDAGCQAADQNNTITSLSNIIAAIVSDFSGSRLIPNGTP